MSNSGKGIKAAALAFAVIIFTGLVLGLLYIVIPHAPAGEVKPEYTINCVLDSDSDLSGVHVECKYKGQAKELIEIKITFDDSHLYLKYIRAETSAPEDITIFYDGMSIYYFNMPAGDTVLYIGIGNAGDSGGDENPGGGADKQYDIVIESLGWGGPEMVDLTCPDKAAANEVVRFTAVMRAEYLGQYYISCIRINLCNDDEYAVLEQVSDGEYTFRMPTAETLARNENYIQLMFYIMPSDSGDYYYL